MKKLLFFLTFIVLSISAMAETKVGSYICFGELNRDIEAAYKSKGELVVFIEVIGDDPFEHNVMIRIKGEKTLIDFISKLEICKNKFTEWSTIAKNNSVTDLKKPLDIQFPNIEVWWRGSSKWHSSFSRDFIHFTFLAQKDGCIMGFFSKAEDWENEYITQKFSLLFKHPHEIDSLIKALDVNSIKAELNRSTHIEALFN